MWEPRRLTNRWASTACYRDSFTFYFSLSMGTHLQSSEHYFLDGRKVTFPEDLRLLTQRQHPRGVHWAHHVRHLPTWHTSQPILNGYLRPSKMAPVLQREAPRCKVRGTPTTSNKDYRGFLQSSNAGMAPRLLLPHTFEFIIHDHRITWRYMHGITDNAVK
jgi:hypothetical protein